MTFSFLISSCWTGNWEGYLLSLENIIKCFFAHDLLNHAYLMPVHRAQMNALKTEDPETWSALKSGGFVVAKSEIPFTHMLTDQALEQEIKKLKGQGGMVGLSRDEGAPDHLVTTVPYLAAQVDQYLDSFPKNSRSSDRKEHYHYLGKYYSEVTNNFSEFQHLIQLHCGWNPFKERTLLKRLVSSALALKEVKNYSLQRWA